MQYARQGDAVVVRRLLAEGADPNYVESTKNPETNDQNLWTPLHIACTHGHSEVARILCDFGADRNFCSTFTEVCFCVGHFFDLAHQCTSRLISLTRSP